MDLCFNNMKPFAKNNWKAKLLDGFGTVFFFESYFRNRYGRINTRFFVLKPRLEYDNNSQFLLNCKNLPKLYSNDFYFQYSVKVNI